MSQASDADRYLIKQPKLRLACKRCGAAGLIPLPQLDRLLFCNACRVCYRVERAGLVEVLPPQEESIKVAVRTNSSAWREHRAVIREHPSIGKRLRSAAIDFVFVGWGRWLAAASLTLILVAASFSGATVPASTAPTALPALLDDRAVLWTTALARRDMATLTGLTDPSQHRALRIWLAHGSGLPTPSEAGTPLEAAISKVVANPSDMAHAKVSTRLSQAGAPR